jgi:KDEL-tailed cysteine endopeptidase
MAMIIALLTIALLLATPAASARFSFEESEIATEEAAHALYQRWAAHHHVARDAAETARRFAIFKEKARRASTPSTSRPTRPTTSSASTSSAT